MVTVYTLKCIKMDESKLIFFTGAPGSKWSAISYLLAETPLINISKEDRSPERVYSHGDKFNGVQHVGSYFGPGFENGQQFHNLHLCTKEHIINEISKVFDDNDKYKVIRCHQFSYNLDYIKEKFPQSKIVIVMRHPDACWDGWYGVGGFDIAYPDYHQFYKDEETAKKLIKKECLIARKWIYEQDLHIHTSTFKYWQKIWNLNIKDHDVARYLNSTIGYFNSKDDPLEHLKYDVHMSFYNFGDVNELL